MELAEALRATAGTVSVVGAGGKKSTLYALANALDRAVLTATVRIPIFDQYVADVAITEDPVSVLRGASAWPLGLVPAQERPDRYFGYDRETVDAIADAGVADVVLVKADGARMREFKAPDDDEPQIPPGTDTVLPIASTHIVGQPLATGYVHRPERVADVTGLSPGDAIGADDVATVLASERGGLKNVPTGATVVPVVNKVDDDELAEVGREIADGVLARTANSVVNVPQVALTKLIADDPVVDVVER